MNGRPARTAAVTLDGDGLRFQAQVGSGHRLVLDSAAGDAGPRPAELVPLALAACTAMDVISILRKKRQPVTGYEVRAAGEQAAEPPNAFTRIEVEHLVEGDVDPRAVRRAIELSATKYCSVGASLSGGTAEIHHRYRLRRAGRPDEADEVLVMGAATVVRDPVGSLA
jgi:putative redox protein